MDLSTLIADLSRIAVGATLLLAGAAKARAKDDLFVASIVSFDLLPERASVAIARVLPPMEISLGVVLILGAVTQFALVAALVLLAGFTVALATALFRHLEVSCGCFGPQDRVRPVRARLLARNLVLLTGVAGSLVIGRVGIGLDSAVGMTLMSELAVASLVVAGTEVAVARM